MTGCVGGVVIKTLLQRYALPRWSAWWSYRRVAQRDDSASDVRAEAQRLIPKDFRPERYYQREQIFLGLNNQSKPITVAVSKWQTENQKIIGPTQTGKGVLIGVQLDQAIRQHMCTIFIDPKPDKHALAIMKQACTASDRQLITLDFNGYLPGKWAPFRTGTEREIKTRLYTALGLMETGNESDFFKIKERQIIDSLFPHWDKEIHSLYKALEGMDSPPARAQGIINEFRTLKSINPGKHRGVDIERALKENAVIYVRASITDPLIIQVCSLLIQCILQSAMRMYTNQERESHLFLCIDEVRFMVTDLLADTLATITGANAHLAIAYQSLEDIRNIKDINVNAKSVEKSINVNCKSTIYYQAADFETAVYAAEQTGTRQASRYRYSVNQNILGGETYDNKHTISQEEQAYISTNTLLMLPERVAVHKRPNQLAELLYTAWINVEKDIRAVSNTADKTENRSNLLPQDKSLPSAVNKKTISLDDAIGIDDIE